MTNAITSALPVALPVSVMPELQPVSFSEVMSRIESERARLQSTGFTSDGAHASDSSKIRPMLEGLIASENSVMQRGSRLDRQTKTIPELSKGKGLPQAFGKDDTEKSLESLNDAMTNMIDVGIYVVRMQIINKSVQGFQRVVDQLGRGQ